MSKAKQLKDKDLYKLIGVLSDADENAIKKAYRKKALSCHPDKNPDNPEAAAKFHELSEALEVLTDPEARKAYDNLQKAKRANEVRNNLLDAKRKKMKDDLEAREKAAQSCTKDDPILAEKILKAEIERLQKEGKRQLEEEQEKLREMMKEEQKSQNTTSNFPSKITPTKLKVRWKYETPKYDENSLKNIFCKYGDVGDVVPPIKSKKKGYSSLIEMQSYQAASLAADIEKGFDENPLKVSLLSPPENSSSHGQNYAKSEPPKTSFDNTNQFQSASNFNDYENLVMRQLRQEEERKRLIEEMRRQDAEDEQN